MAVRRELETGRIVDLRSGAYRVSSGVVYAREGYPFSDSDQRTRSGMWILGSYKEGFEMKLHINAFLP